jgi:hypothetical protein
MDPNLWHPEDRNRPGTKAYKDEVEQLRAICAECPAQKACLEYAMSTYETLHNGIWAGTTPDQRREIKAKEND